MLYKEIIAVCDNIYTKQTHKQTSVAGMVKYVSFLNAKRDGTYSSH